MILNPQISSSWAKINRGNDELEFTLKPRAAELGLSQQSLARQVRQAFYGEEAQRIMRGTDEIRVMVRLPKKDRQSLHTLARLKIRTPSGSEVPLATVADFKPTKSPSFVERNDKAEVIRIGARPKDDTVDILKIARDMKPEIQKIINEEKNLSFQYTGYIAEHAELKRRNIIASITLTFALFALLAIPFKSVMQPIYVLLALPFGVIGAMIGHLVMGINLSWLSIFGMLALAGVVVNDSLVMVDHVNRKLKEGMDLKRAAIESGTRRFRPILLTSLTTFAGLFPLLMDNSLQAQFLIPMATSLGFGVLFATAITLYLIPCALLFADDFKKIIITDAIKATKNGFSNYFNFNGRASRSEFWYWIIFVFTLIVISKSIDTVLTNSEIGYFNIITTLIIFIPSLSVTWRRLHDINRSGAWYFILFTIIGSVLLLVWTCIKGTSGTNRFGPDPLANDNDSTDPHIKPHANIFRA
ncbi:MAG: hypothetical protein CMO36_02050 [Verrucomicrobiaceae bacterium]|nr:hypothetical protein [Verrucomicrobiaceae bacterium]